MTNYAVTGIYRSGTTLCYNILLNLIKQSRDEQVEEIPTGVKIGDIHLHKFHEQVLDLNFDEYKVIYSYRDILDCLSSFIIKYKSSFENFNIHGKGSIDFIKWMIDIDESIQNKHGFAELCYEECIKDTDNLVNNIASYYNINIPVSFDKSQFQIENVKKITDMRKEHSRIDNYHPRHVHNGEVGRWKTFFTEEQRDLIFNKTKYLDWKYNRYKDHWI